MTKSCEQIRSVVVALSNLRNPERIVVPRVGIKKVQDEIRVARIDVRSDRVWRTTEEEAVTGVRLKAGTLGNGWVR